MPKKTEIRMIKNGKAPAHLNQLCTSLVLLQGVTKISPLLQLRWLTKNHTPPWKSILLTGQHSTSNNLASESPATTLSVWFLEKSTLFPLRFDIYRTTKIGPIFFFPISSSVEKFKTKQISSFLCLTFLCLLPANRSDTHVSCSTKCKQHLSLIFIPGSMILTQFNLICSFA